MSAALGHLPPAVLGLLLLACAPECRPPDHLEMVGTPPAYADLVREIAQDKCGVQIVGRLEWVDEPFMCGWIPAAGCEYGDGCGLDAVVTRFEPAWRSAEAHEFGHLCLGRDEAVVQAWAAEVNEEARRRAGEE